MEVGSTVSTSPSACDHEMDATKVTGSAAIMTAIRI